MDSTMDCCICLAAIEATTSSVRTACGHHFHFGCLATWSKTKSSCPMCRQAFTETETPDWSGPESMVMYERMGNWQTELVIPFDRDVSVSARIQAMMSATPGAGRNFMLDSLMGRPGAWRRALREHLQGRMNARPIEEVPREGLDPISVDFIMEYAMVTRRRAEAYLQFFGDPIETVMCLASPSEDPIPSFQERDRPDSDEPYISRWTGNRDRTGFHYSNRDGYDSA